MTQSVTIGPASRRRETRPISGGHTAECRAWLSGAASMNLNWPTSLRGRVLRWILAITRRRPAAPA